MLGDVAGVNLVGAIRFEARQGGNVFVTFLVENPAAEVKFRFAKIRRVRFPAIGLAARIGREKRNLFV